MTVERSKCTHIVNTGEKWIAVKFEEMMKELFAPKDRAAIRQKATRLAKRHVALRERSRRRIASSRDDENRDEPKRP